jgi:micrococcal nuclease
LPRWYVVPYCISVVEVKMLTVEAARAGAAHSYVYHGHPSARADEIAAAEQEAKAAGRGLWGPPCFGQTTSVPT